MKGVEVAVNGDGSDALDFTYIQDLVHGICRVIESDRSRGEIFNLTYGESRTMKQMADILSAHFSDITIKYLPKDKLMPERGTLCVDKARELLGYNPQFPLEKGFVNYIEWYKQLFEDRNKKTISDKVEVIGDKRRTMPKARRKKEAPSIAPVSVP
jgi:nucleoside-diphosphate-sugar epimerase